MGPAHDKGGLSRRIRRRTGPAPATRPPRVSTAGAGCVPRAAATTPPRRATGATAPPPASPEGEGPITSHSGATRSALIEGGGGYESARSFREIFPLSIFMGNEGRRREGGRTRTYLQLQWGPRAESRPLRQFHRKVLKKVRDASFFGDAMKKPLVLNYHAALPTYTSRTFVFAGDKISHP